MPVSSFKRPASSYPISFWFKIMLLCMIVGTIVYLMLWPLPQTQKQHYYVTQIQLTTQPLA